MGGESVGEPAYAGRVALHRESSAVMRAPAREEEVGRGRDWWFPPR